MNKVIEQNELIVIVCLLRWLSLKHSNGGGEKTGGINSILFLLCFFLPYSTAMFNSFIILFLFYSPLFCCISSLHFYFNLKSVFFSSWICFILILSLVFYSLLVFSYLLFSSHTGVSRSPRPNPAGQLSHVTFALTQADSCVSNQALWQPISLLRVKVSFGKIILIQPCVPDRICENASRRITHNLLITAKWVQAALMALNELAFIEWVIRMQEWRRKSSTVVEIKKMKRCTLKMHPVSCWIWEVTLTYTQHFWSLQSSKR